LDEIVDAGDRLFSGAAFCDKKLLALPLADPSALSVISKREKSALRHQRINLRPNGRCLRRPEVIVYHEPATGHSLFVSNSLPSSAKCAK
jgi:hypothetical protein